MPKIKHNPFRVDNLSMCQGPNEDRAREHQERADYHKMMAGFYSLRRPQQIAFMAFVTALKQENENG